MNAMTSTLLDHFHAHFTAAVGRSGKKQREIAAGLGVTEGTVSKALDRNAIGRMTLERLAEIVEIIGEPPGAVSRLWDRAIEDTQMGRQQGETT